MTSENNLISLKEAAQISGYSADYIGQLIRGGKIPGKQVCCNVAWMTTKDAVLNYKNKGKETVRNSYADSFMNKGRQLGMELGIIKLFFKTFKYSLPLLVFIIISFSFLSFFVISLISENKKINFENNSKIKQNEQNLVF